MARSRTVVVSRLTTPTRDSFRVASITYASYQPASRPKRRQATLPLIKAIRRSTIIQRVILAMDPADDRLDETLEETFPASDAPANTIETGIALEPGPETVHDNRSANRFE